ncbi:MULTISPECIES: type I DNA topoisomerase [Micrococcaceae]|uniref:type I DNA topoisomerase n=1 Tax=Micrococcaceae TaxID=1268 RepID=UPI00161B09B9|nr:type I DNA topoisomerase [Citricoccus sp.]MBB5749780.1 DNA topoisomerase-1 [Micrococcus sp. TA1]HRO29335.1 type I DNA topoisomerase [Citricoccus sp.]HRO92632.1 type I DNA topoisomerase [Citricoccus sp.]
MSEKVDGTKLVIVESPAKSKSIAKYLGEGWVVDASAGHIRDLPQPSDLPADMKKGPYGKFAVDTTNGFEPYYVVYPDKKKRVTELKRELKDASALYLATDADREGEAIAWHLLQELKPKVPVYRMTFTEITKEGIARGLENIREIDADLVDAQETRRILDRLFGYEISPVLWRKVARGLSAGRVQSVATRLVVERERERMAFVPASYWDLDGTFTAQEGPGAGESFTARLATVDGRRIASGRDFTDRGVLKDSAEGKVATLTEATATALAEGLQGAAFTVDSVEDKPYTRRPAAPFTTSTLQQEASRKLRFSSRVTMQVAQRLYENGYITYMRTDSVMLSDEAITAARRQATELYGPESIPQAKRVYKAKNDSAQEAHEAIRPAGDSFRTPGQVSGALRGDEFRLYELIWKRTIASQMADAKGYTATVKLSGTATGGEVAGFTASGTVITFPGFLAAYEEGRDTESEKPEGKDKRLPDLAAGQSLTGRDVIASGHETSPPPRYTEASIVAELEKREIGRPSTYAPTISTIMDRGYVTKRGNALVPSWTAFSVIRLLEEHFGRYVDYDFTARMEDDLDRIAAGELQREAWLQAFYFGAESGTEGLKAVVDNLGDIDARAVNSIPVAEGITLRVGKFGPYLEKDLPADAPEGTDPERANVPEDLAPDELTPAKAEELFATAGPSERVLGVDPESGRTIVAKDGRYGPYVTEVIEEMTEEQLEAWMEAQPTEYYKNGKPKPKKKPAKVKPRTGSLFKSMSLETITLEDALRLMSLPRVVGQDAEGTEITVQNGRFGPYLKKGTDSRSLESEDQIFTITLQQALDIYAQPKQRGRGAAKPPLAEFGEDPVSGKKVVVKEGRFGPYVTDGETNITVPRAMDPESLTAQQAYELLADKRAKGPAKKPARKPAARSKSTAKK